MVDGTGILSRDIANPHASLEAPDDSLTLVHNHDPTPHTNFHPNFELQLLALTLS